MTSEIPLDTKNALPNLRKKGTLAIDLGNSTTVVAFQGELESQPTLVEIPSISRVPGEIPSLIWYSEIYERNLLVGQQVFDLGLTVKEDPNLNSDFKRWIGASEPPKSNGNKLSPERAGEILIKKIWEKLPPELEIKRLVLSAPIETYRSYRAWLNKVCSTLPVSEIALVDEPTAAAMGAGLPPGSKLLVVDIGGSTIDLSLVALEGGEGRADPVAQLMRFGGEDLEGKSKQALRCAKVLGKAGIRLGGRDLDRWIAHHLFPETSITEVLLNASEKLKCRLSNNAIDAEVLTEVFLDSATESPTKLSLSRIELEKLFLNRGLLQSLEQLLKKTLSSGRANGCSLKDLQGVVLVGGGARIPLIRRWLTEQIKPAQLITPPPIEAVAKGALSLTPGVRLRDVLHRGVSLRCWDERSKRHKWHPLFLAGQPWPTSNPLELVLAASKPNQSEIELVIGTQELTGMNEVIYKNGMPIIEMNSRDPGYEIWSNEPIALSLDPPGQPGEDCLRLQFSIGENSNLIMEGIDIRTDHMLRKNVLGSVR